MLLSLVSSFLPLTCLFSLTFSMMASRSASLAIANSTSSVFPSMTSSPRKSRSSYLMNKRINSYFSSIHFIIIIYPLSMKLASCLSSFIARSHSPTASAFLFRRTVAVGYSTGGRGAGTE